MKRTFHADGDTVFADPLTRKNPDGSSSISIGFPVCRVDDCVRGDDGADSPAIQIAQALTHFGALVEALTQAATELQEAAAIIEQHHPMTATLFEAAARRARETVAATSNAPVAPPREVPPSSTIDPENLPF